MKTEDCKHEALKSVTDRKGNDIEICELCGYSKVINQSVHEEQVIELVAALRRLITAAKPHCVPTSTLHMRVVESEMIIQQYTENIQALNDERK